MKIVFVTVGTSLFDRGLAGPREASDDPERIRLLRDAFVVGGDEAEKKMLSAELASLCRLFSRYPLATGDRLVLLATDSPEGRRAVDVLGQVLRNHPALDGAEVETEQPPHWQAHDPVLLAERGASNLLAAVSRWLAVDLRARPLFVLTGGIKLGISVLSQVSCWSQATAHDGLFFKLEDPGGVFFPPWCFDGGGDGQSLLPRLPGTVCLRPEVPFTERLREIAAAMEPPGGGGRAPLTTLVVTSGIGLVRQKDLLAARFGSPRLADDATWREIDGHWRCRSWRELRAAMRDAPGEQELADASEGVVRQLQDAWSAGRTRDLPAELAALRSLWAGHPPAPLLRGRLHVLLLATDSLTGEYCASLEAGFLELLEGIAEVEVEAVPGFHPFGGPPTDGDLFTRMAELVGAAAARCKRLLMVPLGGTKLHLPLLTMLATRLHAPLILGHAGLEHPVVIPWLQQEGGRVRGAGDGVAAAWPELASFPTVRLEIEGA